MHLRSHDGISLARSHMRRTQQVALVVARCFVLHPGCSTVVRLKHASRLRTQRASAHCISSPTLVFWDLTHQRPHSFRPRVHRAAGLLFCFFQPLLMLRHQSCFLCVQIPPMPPDLIVFGVATRSGSQVEFTAQRSFCGRCTVLGLPIPARLLVVWRAIAAARPEH